jgi:uncharacterized protein (TIGR02246 family)
MRGILFLVGGIVCVAVVGVPIGQSRPGPREQAPQTARSGAGKTDHSADEATIRANIAAFEKAYNAGDAKAVAALFTTDAQIEDKDGDVAEGRDAIAKTFADLFAESPKKRIEIFVESIRFIGADLAVEVGSTKETVSATEPPEYDRYTVLHVRRDGKWMMALARDEEGPTATSHERLEPLAWLIGEWVDDGGSTVVTSSCRWSEDGKFLLQDFKMQLHGRDAMDVRQRIGWDPQQKCIRSWVFDSEGGFGEGLWTRGDGVWLIKATGVRPDGTTASATNVLMPTGRDGYIFQSTDRVVAGDTQPPTEVRVVRKPPQPK